jgi:hypothetical protein
MGYLIFWDSGWSYIGKDLKGLATVFIEQWNGIKSGAFFSRIVDLYVLKLLF